MPKYLLYFKTFAPALIVLLVDQLSKNLVKIILVKDAIPIDIIGHYLQFTYVVNSGAAFGLKIEDSLIYSILFLLTFLITVYIIYYLVSVKEQMNYETISLSLILGGALGNLVDRGLTVFHIADYTGVIDFIYIGISRDPSGRWYIFNIADMSVTIGICLYLFYTYYYSNKKKEDIIDERS